MGNRYWQNCYKEDANEVISYIRRLLYEKFDKSWNNTRILYGGSVKPSNIKGFHGYGRN